MIEFRKIEVDVLRTALSDEREARPGLGKLLSDVWTKIQQGSVCVEDTNGDGDCHYCRGGGGCPLLNVEVVEC